ncbi:hypothetical protein ARTHRO9AX_80376 [Arthrobacter sp. 9AX]|nr:hypothetical protein ARTHRO9AX_80376 [Arthrobacter sp. 9AX]
MTWTGRPAAARSEPARADRPKEALPLNKGFPLLLHSVLESGGASCYLIATNKAGTTVFAGSFAL